MAKLLLHIIHIYQKTISPDHGFTKHLHPYGFCRYYPSCSEYACQAISKFGVFNGCRLALFRLLRCNPFSKPAYDPVPPPGPTNRNIKKFQ